MKEKELTVKAAIQILKPVNDVFEAIVDPALMSGYFISKGSGRMEEGRKIIWKFSEFEPEFPITVGRIEKDKYISYTWEVEGADLMVEMTLADKGADKTVVTITEGSMKNNDAGIKWLKGNTEGWANFLACLKAYLEYGINLRKGAFDFLSDKI